MYRTLIAGVVLVGCASDPPPAPIAAQTAPGKLKNVPPTLLEHNRIAGTIAITPPDSVRMEIMNSNVMDGTRIRSSFKFCLDESGAVNRVVTLESSNFPEYDQHVEQTIEREWKFRPYLEEGRPVAVCSAVTFFYTQHHAR